MIPRDSLIKKILIDHMHDEEIQSIAVLSEKLGIPYKDLNKYLNGKKIPGPAIGYKILKDLHVSEEIIEKYFAETYGGGNTAYLEMMRGKLEEEYGKASN